MFFRTAPPVNLDDVRSFNLFSVRFVKTTPWPAGGAFGGKTSI